MFLGAFKDILTKGAEREEELVIDDYKTSKRRENEQEVKKKIIKMCSSSLYRIDNFLVFKWF